MVAQSKHSSPHYIGANQEPVALTKLQLGGAGHVGDQREAFIQGLVHKHPDVLPMHDIEPAFIDIVSVCRELPTEAGSLDNLWITPSGGIVLGECKLVRNPQARREVVVQALDYARAISHWQYEQLEEAVRKARKEPLFKMWSLVSDDVDEAEFVDAVQRRLQIGQFLILIIGDGIQEGVEALTSHLQLHAGMHAGLALVDLSVWQGVDGGMLIVPRVPMKTVQIVRGVVRIGASGQVKIEPPPTQGSLSSTDEPRAKSQSETEFYAELDQRRPGLSSKLQTFIEGLIGFGVRPEPGPRSIYLRWQSPDLGIVTIGNIDSAGKLWSQRVLTETRKIGLGQLGENYMESLASTIGGFVKSYDGGGKEVLMADSKGVDVTRLVGAGDAWRDAIAVLAMGLSARDSRN